MRIRAITKSKEYDIDIEKGLVRNEGLSNGFVVTDSKIYRLYRNLIRKGKFVVGPGEKSKSLKIYQKIIRELVERKENVNRIVAFGGGVVGDVAGLVASSYNRGIELVQVPTSLLSMVDSSIGGKNSVNFMGIKNRIGTIYQPDSVLIDPVFLETLPEEEIRNGGAEIVKYSVMFGFPDLKRLKRGVSVADEDLEYIIGECCKIKARVVEKDERDCGCRHVLNHGHTFGHGIEAVCGLSHGEAISIGMVKESRLGEKFGVVEKGVADKVKGVLQANGLPVEFPDNVSIDDLIDAMKQDKKGPFVFAFDRKNYNYHLDERAIREILGNLE